MGDSPTSHEVLQEEVADLTAEVLSKVSRAEFEDCLLELHSRIDHLLRRILVLQAKVELFEVKSQDTDDCLPPDTFLHTLD